MNTPGTEHTTKKLPPNPYRQLTEKDLAYAALEAAKRSNDLAGIEAARIWVARIQVEERQARLLLLQHVSEKMARDLQAGNRNMIWR